MNIMQTIDARTEEILRAIIINYINKLEPVSSRKLSKTIPVKLSPATIRNVMVDLEECGFLLQPHTSAGRVPTDQAYRYFVEHLLEETTELSAMEQQLIKSQIEQFQSTEGLILKEIPKIINRISSYIGVLIASQVREVLLKKLHFVSVDEQRILSIIVTDDETIYQKILSVDEPITQDELNKIANFVNDEYAGCKLPDIREKIRLLMDEEQSHYGSLLQKVQYFSNRSFEDVFHHIEEEELYIEGTTNIFNLPELADIDKMKRIVEAFMEKKRLLLLLSELIKEDGINICIGSESHLSNLEDLSFIISPFKKGNLTAGGIAVIGPTRMPYDRMIALIDYISKQVSSLLTTKEVMTLE